MSIFKLSGKVNHICSDGTALLNIGSAHPTLSISNKELVGETFGKGDVVEFEATIKTRVVVNNTTGVKHKSAYLHASNFKSISVQACNETVIEEDFVMGGSPEAPPVGDDDAPF
jgi:hypothetical protein